MRNSELKDRGFEYIGSLDWYKSYEWATFGVWVKGHQLFWDTDSGCSCSVPWGSGVDPQPATLNEIRQEARNRSKWEGRDATEAFIREIEGAVKNG